jgi:hypothetical protein
MHFIFLLKNHSRTEAQLKSKLLFKPLINAMQLIIFAKQIYEKGVYHICSEGETKQNASTMHKDWAPL